ncbi:MAG: MmcQ/YjbR family DNA-binding protein [Pseudomonadota bacterium]
MMDQTSFDAHCGSLTATFMVEQWYGAHVWKVGNEDDNKVFALSTFWSGKHGESSDNERQHGIVFRVSPTSFAMLTEQPGIAQAPYFAKGNWVRVVAASPLTSGDIATYVSEAHRLVASTLKKRVKSTLGLLEPVSRPPP